jgi:hypothetical protein
MIVRWIWLVPSDLRVAVKPFHFEAPDISGTAKNLHRVRRVLHGHIAGKAFCNRALHGRRQARIHCHRGPMTRPAPSLLRKRPSNRQEYAVFPIRNGNAGQLEP